MIEFGIEDIKAALFLAKNKASPLIVINAFDEEEGLSLVKVLSSLDGPDFHLLCISHLNWDFDMTPWDIPPIFPSDKSKKGGADRYLAILLKQIIPKAKSFLEEEPSFYGIVGYSLGGLFALYASSKCDLFSRVASISGSLWYEGFKEYLSSSSLIPKRVYLSLGDKEEKTKNKILSSVRASTEEIASIYREKGSEVIFEMNQGNHFADGQERTIKGLFALLK